MTNRTRIRTNVKTKTPEKTVERIKKMVGESIDTETLWRIEQMIYSLVESNTTQLEYLRQINTKYQRLVQNGASVNSTDISQKAVIGALKSTIDAHGPITSDYIKSAAKRICSQLIGGNEREQ